MKGLGYLSTFPVVFALIALLCLCSCKNDSKTRSYREIEVKSPEVKKENKVKKASAPFSSPPLDSSKKLIWETPKGWTQEKGSGMRIATFFFNDKNKTAECTLTKLAGDAGGIVNNVTRWMKQLSIVIPPDDKLKGFLDKQERFTTPDGHKGVMVDFSSMLSGNLISSKTSYTSMIMIDGYTVFVKLVGDKSLLQENKEKFMKLCHSLKFAKKDD